MRSDRRIACPGPSESLVAIYLRECICSILPRSRIGPELTLHILRSFPAVKRTYLVPALRVHEQCFWSFKCRCALFHSPAFTVIITLVLVFPEKKRVYHLSFDVSSSIVAPTGRNPAPDAIETSRSLFLEISSERRDSQNWTSGFPFSTAYFDARLFDIQLKIQALPLDSC
ncbi:hypothetical protein CC2G_006110 [Coprinopsis cinerea AmutBmut pab1-1]|nr:hypothetical protein CC2G_006110 [Coprinopsis cinerea AmutBmut pab1-1]